MRLDKEIELGGELHTAVAEFSDWPHGICVKITVCDSKNEKHSTKISCSASMSSAFPRVVSLSEKLQLEEAWRIFEEMGQESDFEAKLKSIVTLLIPWSED